MCASYLILMIRHFRSPFSSFLHRLYRLADGSWLLNAVLLVCIFSEGVPQSLENLSCLRKDTVRLVTQPLCISTCLTCSASACVQGSEG